MKFLLIFSLFLVTLLARNRKYLIELEDENEIIDEKEKNHIDEENLLNHEEKNNDEEKNVKSRKVSQSSLSSKLRKTQQNKAMKCTHGARCHRRPGNENCYCQGPDCVIETSLDGRTIFAKGRNAVCESKGTPGVTNFTFLLL